MFNAFEDFRGMSILDIGFGVMGLRIRVYLLFMDFDIVLRFRV